MADVVRVDDPSAINRAATALDEGGVVVVPTDTVYGLAARADQAMAVGALFEIKDRPAGVPVAVLVADRDQAGRLLADLPSWAADLVDRYWPGPLTIIGTRRPGLDLELGEPAHTIGVRCPDHSFIRSLAARTGALATTSANRHGRPTPATAADVVGQLGALLPPATLVVDGGPCVRAPSTVVDVTGTAPVILRQGDLDLPDAPRP